MTNPSRFLSFVIMLNKSEGANGPPQHKAKPTISMNRKKKRIQAILEEMAAIYEFKEEGFRARAYEKAAGILANLDKDLEDYSEKELAAIDGLGSSTIEKIQEFLDKGKIKAHEKLKGEAPMEMVELSQKRGFGPKSMKKLYKTLGITSKSELRDALESGQVSELKGFGKKTVDQMLEALRREGQSEDRLSYWQAREIVHWLKEQMGQADGIEQMEVAGSFRRGKSSVGDLDLLVSCQDKDRKAITEQFKNLEGIDEVLLSGEKKTSIRLEENNLQIDLRLIDPEQWGAALVYFTGSKNHNIQLRKIAQKQDKKINEYGVFNQDEKNLGSKTEKAVYQALGLNWVAPELREDAGEIKAADNKRLPHLLRRKQIKGDLHMHSTWSDGRKGIKELAQYLKEEYKYEYMAITDHSKALTVANGLDEERLREQIQEIKSVNQELGQDFIKSGIEVDIMADGSLDLDDKVLSELDWVIASIHRKFNQDNTERLIKACQNPYVTAIGHPTGRLIGRRAGYSLHMEKVMQVAAETGTALEINAQPKRMDLSDQHARFAQKSGVMLVINTDSHNLKNYLFMDLGVQIARRAWCEPKHILNTKSWEEIADFVQKKRKKLKQQKVEA